MNIIPVYSYVFQNIVAGLLEDFSRDVYKYMLLEKTNMTVIFGSSTTLKCKVTYHLKFYYGCSLTPKYQS